MSDSTTDLKPGDRIGKYKVLGELGRGGLAVVYLAEQKFTKRQVAVKLFTTQDERALVWAQREAEFLASIDHPYIISLYDADEDEGQFYIVVEYIHGKTLREMITAEDALPITVALKLMTDIVDALDYAHNLGVIHGDIKPSNIIVSSSGTPVLTDFCFSDALPLAGTPHYRPPEGWQRVLEKRSDLWSLGMTFHDLMTGRLPFEAKDEEAIRQIVTSEKPLALSLLHQTVPKPVAHIIERCLQKDLNERYQSAAALRRDLESALAYLELGQDEGASRGAVPLRPGSTIMLNVEYKEPGIAGQYREYQLEEALGQGSFSVVYRAADVIGNRPVALKILRQERADDEKVLVRFQREASLLARLDHANVVQVHNFGRYGADFFIVMEVLTGPTLKDALECGFEFRIEDAVAVMVQILAGLERIHAEGVIHRDVKPENIKLQPERTVVMDLGLAHISSGAQLTMSGEVLGTPRYMAPEQARGEKITFHSDLYTAGVVLYELLTGQIPHEADSTVNLIFKIAIEAPEPVTKYRRDLPPALVAFLNRVLAREPTERFSSTQLAYEDLLTSVGWQSNEVLTMHRQMFNRLKATLSRNARLRTS